MKPAIEYTAEERRAFYASAVRKVLAGMKRMPCGKFSGQQISYARGRATVAMKKAGF